eukprot:TRINITY_DN4216_c0_g2_i10.p1 TRINITY_DN4216_c0_g2~~TRINITY_DN4216_c0_g2_i10.p1  ORF type:complete len:680 (-),score=115.23 TRINITY_DN4216_c0_g2_i10:545-2584(-)
MEKSCLSSKARWKRRWKQWYQRRVRGSSGMNDERTLDVKECMNILNTFPRKKDVLDAFLQLKQLSKGNDTNKEGIGANGGSALLLTLVGHTDIEIQREAIRLLRSISVNEFSQQQISQDKGIPKLLDLLVKTDDFSLNLGATAILWNLSVNDENKRTIVTEGGVPLLINLIKTNDIKLQNEAVGCIRNLSMDEGNKKILGREGVIPQLVRLLSSKEEKIQRNAALSLRNLTCNNEKNLARVDRENAADLLVRVLAQYNLESSQKTTSNSVAKKLNFESSISWADLRPEIQTKIGEGKYGDVFKAYYHAFPIACKVIKKELTENDAEQTLEELKIMSILKHPNVVLLMGACLSPQNQVVIITEFCDRGNLKDVLPEVKSLWSRLKFGEDIALGLSWLHAHHIIHRDLKLANLLVAQDWTVKISDFGLSLQQTPTTVCRGFKGNVKYSPPEILRARYDKSITVYPYSEKTDTYAFGLMLWELVTAEPLFPDIKGKEDLTERVLAGHRPPLKKEWPDCLNEVLTSCWHAEASRRPYFPAILKRYDTVVSETMCLDPTGRKLLKLLWGVKVLKRTHTVPYADLEKALSDLMRDADPNDVKEIDIKCLKAILCDPFDDNVELQRCCQVINWFGPIKPYNQFFQNVCVFSLVSVTLTLLLFPHHLNDNYFYQLFLHFIAHPHPYR